MEGHRLSIASVSSFHTPSRSMSRMSTVNDPITGEPRGRIERPITPEDPDLVQYKKELRSVNKKLGHLRQVAGKNRTGVRLAEEVSHDDDGNMVTRLVTASEKFLKYRKEVQSSVVNKLQNLETELRDELWEKLYAPLCPIIVSRVPILDAMLLECEDTIISDGADQLGSLRTIDNLQQQRRNMISRRVHLEVTKRQLNEWAISKRLREEVDRSISLAREKKRRARFHAMMDMRKLQDPRSARRYSVMSNFSRRRESNASAMGIPDMGGQYSGGYTPQPPTSLRRSTGQPVHRVSPSIDRKGAKFTPRRKAALAEQQSYVTGSAPTLTKALDPLPQITDRKQTGGSLSEIPTSKHGRNTSESPLRPKAPGSSGPGITISVEPALSDPEAQIKPSLATQSRPFPEGSSNSNNSLLRVPIPE